MTYQPEPETNEADEPEGVAEDKAVMAINNQPLVQDVFQVPDAEAQMLMQNAVQALRR